jgi:hypothetical protein
LVAGQVLYVDLGRSKSELHEFSPVGIPISGTAMANLNPHVKAMVRTVAGEYRVVSDPAWTVDVLGGTRLLQVKPTLGYSITGELAPVVTPGRNVSKQVNESLWDAIFGVKGRYAFGDDRK